jgi:hypothetical protein
LLDIDSVEIAGSSSLDSMDEPDVLNEGTRDEDETKTDDEVRRSKNVEIYCQQKKHEAKPRITSPQTNVDFGRVKQPLPIRFEVR